MYANPQLRDISETYCADEKDLPPLDDHDQSIQKARNTVLDYKRIIRMLNQDLPEKGKILEIGAFAGFFLNLLKKDGWDVYGIEPGRRGISYARNNFGIEILNETLEGTSLEDECFDAVVILHVIEHLYNPEEGLRVINRVLKTNGTLVIETPTYDTLMFRLLGRRERSLNCDGHIYFFTPESLEALLANNGFRVVRLEKVGRTLTIDRLLWNIGVISKISAIQKALAKLSSALRLHKLSIYLNMRDMQRMYCVKDKSLKIDKY